MKSPSRPLVTHYQTTEGGWWTKFVPSGCRPHRNVHALLLSDGSKWSVRHGWIGEPLPFQSELPQPTHYTAHEGGVWIEFKYWKPGGMGHHPPPNHNLMHSIKFSDGSIFDTVNGWRPRRVEEEKDPPVDMKVFELFELMMYRVRARPELNDRTSARILTTILIEELQRIQKERKT